MTEEELKAQLDLADARLDVIQGRSITPERYRALIASLQAGREAKASAMADASKERAKAKRAAARKPSMTEADLRAMFNLSLTATPSPSQE